MNIIVRLAIQLTSAFIAGFATSKGIDQLAKVKFSELKFPKVAFHKPITISFPKADMPTDTPPPAA